MSAFLRSSTLTSVTCDAPGRLDFLGGVADYSGSLVLEMPTQVRTTVTLTLREKDEARFESEAFGMIAVPLGPLRNLVDQNASPDKFRAHLDQLEFPRWARYSFGCLIVLALHARWFPTSGFSLRIESKVPDGQGVSSSAALEIATLRAFNASARLNLTAIELARLGQRAENLIVGASCGLMDQLASSCGESNALLPILCRPDQVSAPLLLPAGLTLAGWPSGVRHSVGASPYATARAASFMGKRLLETLAGHRWNYISEIPLDLFYQLESELPESMSGQAFISVHHTTDDALSVIDPVRSYPVRAAARFPIEENGRAHRARELLSHYDKDPKSSARELREILQASHQGYGAMRLGCPETDAILERLLAEPIESGLIGGRISGGGSGGTVVVLLEQRARKRLESLCSPLRLIC